MRLLLVRLGARLQRFAEDVAERRARIGRSVLRHSLLLFGDLHRLDREGRLLRTVDPGDLGIELLSDLEAFRTLFVAIAAKVGTLDEARRTIVPDLRGSGRTRFRSPGTPRDGQAVALAQDALDLADGLGLRRFPVVGHDWGGRTAYTLAALAPDRITAVASLALA